MGGRNQGKLLKGWRVANVSLCFDRSSRGSKRSMRVNLSASVSDDLTSSTGSEDLERHIISPA